MENTAGDSTVLVNGTDFTVLFLDKPESCGCPGEADSQATEIQLLEARDNPDYPELVYPDVLAPIYSGNVMTLVGSVPGLTFPADGHDPRCFDPVYLRGSNCKRICGNLPAGKRFVRVIGGSVSHGWARFAETEVYNATNPVRVCIRCKNWAQHTYANFRIEIEFA